MVKVDVEVFMVKQWRKMNNMISFEVENEGTSYKRV